MAFRNDVQSTYVIKHSRNNQEVSRSVSGEPRLKVPLTYK